MSVPLAVCSGKDVLHFDLPSVFCFLHKGGYTSQLLLPGTVNQICVHSYNWFVNGKDIVGKWTFYESERSGGSEIDCSLGAAVVEKIEVKLVFPNLAVDQWNNKGSWTMIYNQVGSQSCLQLFLLMQGLRSHRGWSVLLCFLRLLPGGPGGSGTIPQTLDSKSTQLPGFQVVTSFCNRTRPGQGWSHDVTVRNWACFSGRKVNNSNNQVICALYICNLLRRPLVL